MKSNCKIIKFPKKSVKKDVLWEELNTKENNTYCYAIENNLLLYCKEDKSRPANPMYIYHIYECYLEEIVRTYRAKKLITTIALSMDMYKENEALDFIFNLCKYKFKQKV